MCMFGKTEYIGDIIPSSLYNIREHLLMRLQAYRVAAAMIENCLSDEVEQRYKNYIRQNNLGMIYAYTVYLLEINDLCPVILWDAPNLDKYSKNDDGEYYETYAQDIPVSVIGYGRLYSEDNGTLIQLDDLNIVEKWMFALFSPENLEEEEFGKWQKSLKAAQKKKYDKMKSILPRGSSEHLIEYVESLKQNPEKYSEFVFFFERVTLRTGCAFLDLTEDDIMNGYTTLPEWGELQSVIDIYCEYKPLISSNDLYIQKIEKNSEEFINFLFGIVKGYEKWK